MANCRGSLREPIVDGRGSLREPMVNSSGSLREPMENSRGSLREPKLSLEMIDDDDPARKRARKYYNRLGLIRQLGIRRQKRAIRAFAAPISPRASGFMGTIATIVPLPLSFLASLTKTVKILAERVDPTKWGSVSSSLLWYFLLCWAGSIPMINQMISSATAMQSAQQKTQVAYAVAAKQLDSQRHQGNIAVQLLEAAVKMAAQVSSNSIDTYA
jgi:hypothetical protein